MFLPSNSIRKKPPNLAQFGIGQFLLNRYILIAYIEPRRSVRTGPSKAQPQATLPRMLIRGHAAVNPVSPGAISLVECPWRFTCPSPRSPANDDHFTRRSGAVARR